MQPKAIIILNRRIQDSDEGLFLGREALELNIPELAAVAVRNA
jgi:hypothetical protein